MLLQTLASDDELRAIMKTRLLPSSIDAPRPQLGRAAAAATEPADGAKKLEAAASRGPAAVDVALAGLGAAAIGLPDAAATPLGSARVTRDSTASLSLGVPTPAHVSNAGAGSDAPSYAAPHSTHSGRSTRSTVHEVAVAQFNPVNPVFGQQVSA